MKFKNEYKCLLQNKFSDGEYIIVPLRYGDRIDIMNWRNEQIYHLRQQKPLTEKSQEDYFNRTVAKLFDQEKPNQILFSYLKNCKCIGYGGLVHINWKEKNAEISFIMNTELESNEFSFHWSNFLKLIKRIAFDELQFNSIFTYSYDLRPHLYPVLEKNNFEFKSKNKNEIEIEGKKIDALTYECKNRYNYLKIREVVKEDVKLIFDWSNDNEVRKQSYNSYPINFKEHQNWFNSKLISQKSLFLISEYDGLEIGLVRFEIQNNKCVIGILLDKNFRRKGLSYIMLLKSSKYYFARFNLPIHANIKESNLASVRAFEKAGFKFYEKVIVNGINSFVYKLEKNEFR